ncbi:MAG TPA: glutamate--tRNA ligase family protein [Rhodopila sp.]|jgi:glutamyl-tRNA synthetase
MTRVRFAAIPTGHLTVDSGRVALVNDLFAHRNQGQMLLRLDDLDQGGSGPSPIDQITQDLRWLGIEWHESFRQSERLELYRETIERLKRDNFIYPCFESKEELTAKQAFRRKHNQPLIYDRAMLSLTDKQRRDAEAGGKRPHWRFNLSGRTLEWNDLILGSRHAALSSISDPVVVRADGTPAPILASVVDDIDYATTHVIRGCDNAGNTAVQIELFEVLRGGRKPLRFGHLPALNPAQRVLPRGPKIGSLTLRNLRRDGVEPNVVAACMVGIADEALPLDRLARRLELADLADGRFEVGAMLALNRQVLREMDFAAVADRLPSGATEAFWLAVRGSLDRLKEAHGWWEVVAGTIVPPVIEGAGDLLLTAGSLLPPEPWDNAVWRNWISALERATERTGESLLEPLCLALTGEDNGPDLAHLLPLIGRPRAASRLAIAAA